MSYTVNKTMGDAKPLPGFGFTTPLASNSNVIDCGTYKTYGDANVKGLAVRDDLIARVLSPEAIVHRSEVRTNQPGTTKLAVMEHTTFYKIEGEHKFIRTTITRN